MREMLGRDARASIRIPPRSRRSRSGRSARRRRGRRERGRSRPGWRGSAPPAADPSRRRRAPRRGRRSSPSRATAGGRPRASPGRRAPCARPRGRRRAGRSPSAPRPGGAAGSTSSTSSWAGRFASAGMRSRCSREQRRLAGERRQRRAQLVRDVRGEAPLARLGLREGTDLLLERLGHLVERRRPGAELVVGLDRKPGLEQPLREGVGRLARLRDRAENPPGDERAGGRGENDHDAPPRQEDRPQLREVVVAGPPRRRRSRARPATVEAARRRRGTACRRSGPARRRGRPPVRGSAPRRGSGSPGQRSSTRTALRRPVRPSRSRDAGRRSRGGRRRPAARRIHRGRFPQARGSCAPARAS